MRNLILAVGVLVFVAGCSGATKFDASSELAASKSLIKMADELGPETRGAFQDAVRALMKQEEKAYLRYDGWTANEIINAHLQRPTR